MATELSVKLLISGEAGDLQAKLKAIEQQIRAINGGGSGGAGGSGMFDSGAKSAETFQQALRGLIGRFSALWAAMKSAEGIANVFNVGVKFNAAMEDSRLGIASLIVAQAKLTDSTGKELTGRIALTSAMKLGEDQIQKLRIAGLQTAATTEQLVSAYQDAVGGGLRAGMSLDQIRKLTIQTVQAAGAMGVPMNQLNQEIRSILDGTIDRNSRVAIRLGITNADVEKWKSAGTLFSELNKRMQAFSEAGKESMNNWTVLLSNMHEASQILLGEAFRSPMKNIQAALNDAMNAIINIDTAGIGEKVQPLLLMLKDLGNLFGNFVVSTIKGVSEALLSTGEWWAKNRDAITGALASFRIFMADAAAAIGTVFVGLIKSLAESFMWFSKLPDSIKSVSIASGVFLAILTALNTELAVKSVASIGQMIKKVTELTQVVSYSASYGLAGFKYALASLIDPLMLVVAGVAALAAGIYYLRGQSEREAETNLSLAKNAKDAGEEFNRFALSAKSLDDEMKQSVATKEQQEALDARRKVMINELIKMAPGQIDMIRNEIEKGTQLSEVWKKVANAKLASLQADYRMAKIKYDAAEKEIADANRALNAENSGVTAMLNKMRLQILGKEEALAIDKKALDVMQESVLVLEASIKGQSAVTNLTANELDDAKKKKKIEDERHRLATIRLQTEQMAIEALPKRTVAEREYYETRRAEHQLAVEDERIRHAEIDENNKNLQLTAAKSAVEQHIAQIRSDALTRRQDAEERWYTYVNTQEGDTLARKLANLERVLAAEERHYKTATGLSHSQAELDQVLQERTFRETVAFREQEMKKLEASMKDMEKVKGYTFNFEDQKTALSELAKKLNISEQALTGLIKKFEEVRDRKSDWKSGLFAGLTEAADTLRDKFDMVKGAIKQIISSTESAFATFFQNIIQKGMTGAQKWEALWKTISGAILKAITEILAKQLVLWGVEKGIDLWRKVTGQAQIIQEGEKTAASVAGMGARTAAIGAEATAANLAAPSLIELAVAETWAAYAAMPFIGQGLALEQIGLIMSTYAAAKALSLAGGIGGGEVVASEGMNYPGYALGGVVTKPTFALIGEAGREVIAPENTFLDWIKNVASPAIRVPNGGFGSPGKGEFAFAGLGGNSTSIHANFDGAMIIGDSVEGLRKAASALRVIKKYDDRMNG